MKHNQTNLFASLSPEIRLLVLIRVNRSLGRQDRRRSLWQTTILTIPCLDFGEILSLWDYLIRSQSAECSPIFTSLTC